MNVVRATNTLNRASLHTHIHSCLRAFIGQSSHHAATERFVGGGDGDKFLHAFGNRTAGHHNVPLLGANVSGEARF